ncbi:MAG TPA: FGGY-family carbohydrate kinase [Thermotogota bacterium]|nr:FGGY-family carbohydrate kinase [Thermotogota bacterium]HRW92276.1 FGGY-family carbohydrate kinase [Thermotogota bacterium]
MNDRFPPLYCGIDVGTSTVKAAFFSEPGQLQWNAEQPCEAHWKQGKHTIDPMHWWQSVQKLLSDAPGSLKRRLQGVCITGQGPTIVPVDGNGNKLGNAVTWMDRRGVENVATLVHDGMDPQIASSMAKLLRLREELPKPAWLLQPWDFLAMQFTGKRGNATFPNRGFFSWDRASLEKLGMEKEFLLPPLVSPGEPLGRALPCVCKKLGLPSNLLVVGGAPDFAAGLVGTGSLEEGVVCDRGGTSQGITTAVRAHRQIQGLMTTEHFVPGMWKVSGLLSTTGKALSWFDQEVLQKGDIDGEKTLSRITRPGNLLFLPYLNGERTPHWDPYARGVFFGLSLEHGADSMRLAIFEGVGYAIADVLDRMERGGITVNHLRVSGGQSVSGFWNQVKADITGKNVETGDFEDSELLGAAILAFCGLQKKELRETAGKWFRASRIFVPDPEKHRLYEQLLDDYRHLYRANRHLFERLQSRFAPGPGA